MTAPRVVPLALWLLAAGAAERGIAQESADQGVRVMLTETFDGSGWDRRWVHTRLHRRSNVYAVMPDGADGALQIQSRGSASALVHAVRLDAAGATVSWRWRVDRGPWSNQHERERRGDDYAARVFVAFGADLTDPAVRAICYVWSAHEPVDAVYRSPYADGVATIVVRSGPATAGTWHAEVRDILEDYRRAFGGAPDRAISAVALMADTDNTGSEAVTWFDDIRVERTLR